MDNTTVITGAVILLFSAIIYFFPAIVAADRRLKNCASLFIINLFFGWTLIGWVICLAWSLSGNVKERKVKGRMNDSDRKARMEELAELLKAN